MAQSSLPADVPVATFATFRKSPVLLELTPEIFGRVHRLAPGSISRQDWYRQIGENAPGSVLTAWQMFAVERSARCLTHF